MADKPTTLPEWASTEETDPVSGQLNRVEPPTERKSSGWTRREIPPRQWWNWLLWRIWQWLKWVDSGTHQATASTIMERDANGRSKAADAAADGDVVNRGYGDSRYARRDTDDIKWLSKGIGEYYVVDDSLTGVDVPPTDNDAFRFIKLTAGEDGAGEYNEGVLTSESVSGSSPEVTATAVIDDASSPMNGETVHLINTEERFLRAGVSGRLQDSQFEAHDHGGSTGNTSPSLSITEATSDSDGNPDFVAGADANPESVNIQDAGQVDSHFHSISSEGGNETRPRNYGVTVYQRIA